MDSETPNPSPLTPAKNAPWLIPLAIIAAGAFIGAGLMIGQIYTAKLKYLGSNTTSQESFKEDPEKAKLAAPVTSTDHIRGKISAKIKIVEYSDLDCPYCQLFNKTLKQITSDYPADQVAWVYRHLPFTDLHPQAAMKAQAAECAAEQKGEAGFWAFIDYYFDHQNKNSGLDEVVNMSNVLGLDAKAFRACISSGKYQQKVEEQSANAEASGGRGTPFNILVSSQNPVPMTGNYSYTSLKTQLDKMLK